MTLLMKHIQHSHKYNREETAEHANAYIRRKVRRNIRLYLTIRLHLLQFGKRNRRNIVRRPFNSEACKQLHVFLKRQELEVVARMLRHSLNAKLEPRRKTFNTSRAHLSQSLLYCLDNLLCRNLGLECCTLEIYHTIREEEIRPDAFTLIRKEGNKSRVDDRGEQTTDLAELMVTEDESIITQFREKRVERPGLFIEQNCLGRRNQVGNMIGKSTQTAQDCHHTPL